MGLKQLKEIRKILKSLVYMTGKLLQVIVFMSLTRVISHKLRLTRITEEKKLPLIF